MSNSPTDWKLTSALLFCTCTRTLLSCFATRLGSAQKEAYRCESSRVRNKVRSVQTRYDTVRSWRQDKTRTSKASCAEPQIRTFVGISRPALYCTGPIVHGLCVIQSPIPDYVYEVDQQWIWTCAYGTGSVESVGWLDSLRSIRNVQVLCTGLSLDFRAFLCRDFANFENRWDGVGMGKGSQLSSNIYCA